MSFDFSRDCIKNEGERFWHSPSSGPCSYQTKEPGETFFSMTLVVFQEVFDTGLARMVGICLGAVNGYITFALDMSLFPLNRL